MSSLSYSLSGNANSHCVLFLHGFMGSAVDWKDTAEALSEMYRCLIPDLPGHGGSTGFPPESYTMSGTAAEIIKLLDSLNIERTMLVGYSMGGRLALYLALRYPERCTSLFLESASPGLENERERASRHDADEKKARRLETEDFEGFLQDWYQQPIFASLARDEELLERTIETRLRNDPSELAKSLRGIGTGSQPSLWKELGRLEAPALAVAGELDSKFSALSRRMAAISPQIRVNVVTDVGHNVQGEAPKEYLAILKDHLQRI